MTQRSLAAVFVTFVVATVALAAEWRPTSLPSKTSATGEATWYRCYVKVPPRYAIAVEKDLYRDSVTLNLSDVRGAFTVYLNGQKIIAGDAVPEGARTRFKVPKGILQKDVFNALAIRLDAKAAAHGLGQTPILAGYHDEVELDGAWEITRGNDVDPASLQALPKQPATAFYIDTQWRPARSPLGRNAEMMPGVRVAPAESLGRLKTADDLTVDLLAAEPVVAQPTHISFDERGRMWVAQYRQYPYPAGVKMISRDMYYRSRFDKVPPPPPHHDKGADRITVHEDTTGNGTFDKVTTAIDGLNMANAAVRGHGGIWVMNTPYLMFYPDANGDDVPDRDPEVRLAGFGLEDTHSVSNGLAWGPDGWLYGGQGSTVTCRVTRPGIDPPNAPGVYFEGCMVWRYHPERKVFEIFAEGGGNTFGLDFDSEGRCYSGHNGGVTHGWHYVQSGLYLKQGFDSGKYGPPGNPYAFGSLPQMKSRNQVLRFTHNIVMFEGNALPSQYVGRLFGADPLHHFISYSERYTVGSTFETMVTGTPLKTDSDVTFRPVYLAPAPDGSLYVGDFCEEFIAHGQNYQGQIDPTSGRIYRLRGKDMPLNKDVNLAVKSTPDLVKTLDHANRWHRQTAVRVLGERHDLAAVPLLKNALKEQGTHPALEALWALYQLGALDEATAEAALAHPAAPVRAWAVRLMGDDASKPLPEGFYKALQARIAVEKDPEARSQFACTARRLPAGQALPIVAAMLKHDADAADPYIPLLCWWTIESHCDTERDAVMALVKEPAAWEAATMKQHILSRMMRRFAARGSHADFLACGKLFQLAPTDEHRKLLAAGFEEAFKGRALPPLPQELATALAKSGQASPLLLARLGDKDAVQAALKIAADAKAKPEDRLTSTILFGEVKTPEAVPVLLKVVQGAKERVDLRKAALTALLIYEDDSIGSQVAGFYTTLPIEVRTGAVNLLASRPGWSAAFLSLVESGAVKAGDVPPDVVTRLRAHEDLAARVEKVFPNVPKPKTSRLADVQRVRSIVDAGPGDPYKGEATFLARCAACHTLFFKGGAIGPNLTSYQRDDLGTMLISILDPSAEIREGFQNYMLKTNDGRTFTGFLSDNDAEVVALRGLDGQDVRIPRSNIKELKALPTSIMPEGLIDDLDPQQLRDFFAYLRIPQPISR